MEKGVSYLNHCIFSTLCSENPEHMEFLRSKLR